MTKQALSIVVPTLNEAENIPSLLARIDDSMRIASIPYEVVIVDDHSSDNTVAIADSLSDTYPLQTLLKDGKRGKAYSLLQGFDAAQYQLVAMIDADLQYPPEELGAMYDKLTLSNADLIVTQRLEKKVSPLRKLSTKTFNFLFAKLLFGIDFDTQSGLKLFKKNMLQSFQMEPSPWSFDLEFIVRAIEHKYKVVSHDIMFAQRSYGDSKVNVLHTAFELAKASLRLRWRTSQSQIKEGLRDNSNFLKKAFPFMAAALVISGLSGGYSQQASAISLPVVTNIPIVKNILPEASQATQAKAVALPAASTPVVQYAVRPITVAAPVTSQTTPSTQSQPVTVVNVLPQIPANTITTPVQSNPAGSAVNTMQPATAQQTAQTTPTAVANTTADSGQSIAQPTNNRQQSTATDINNDSTLSAATNTNGKNGIYGSGYPFYKLGDTATERFTSASRLAFIAGILCLIALGVTVGSRKLATARATTK